MIRFVTVLFAVATAGCAGGASRSVSPVTEVQAPPLSGRPADLRARITELDAAITADLGTAGLDAPDATAASAMASTPMAEVRTTCEHVPSDRCGDVCKLSDSICTNASTICELADQLPGDAWAAERCGSAKASCRRATDRCCTGECAATP